MNRWTLAFCIPLGGFAALLAYGVISADLFSQEIWSPEGFDKLIWFTFGYGAAAAILMLCRPRWYRPVVLGTCLAYTTTTVGVSAIGALLLCLAAGYVLGRLILGRPEQPLDELLSLLLGVSLIATAIGLAAHARVHYPVVYVAAFLMPLVGWPRLTLEGGRRIIGLFRPSVTAGRAETSVQALLGFVLSAHWLVSLKPEAGTDGLAMHLAIPAWVAQHHYWSFDFKHFVWAVMPMAGDWIYTAVFLPGGEYAIRLLNFIMLCSIAALVFTAIRKWATPIPAYLATALFCSSPVVQLETGALFVENFWTALLIGSLASLWRFHETRAHRYLVAAGILLGTAMQTKIGALAFFLPVSVIAAWELARSGVSRRFRCGALALLAFVLLAAPPYVNAYIKTGNPVFPFANATFRSPHFESETSFSDLRFKTPLSWNTLYSITIHTDRFLESQKGALGFHYLLLLPLLLVVVRGKWPFEVWTAVWTSLAFFFLTFIGHSNVRYIYPALALWTIGIGWVFASSRRKSDTAYIALMVTAVCGIVLNVYFLPASGWYHKDFFLNPLRGDTARDYLARTAPVRELIDYINVEHAGAPVMLIESSDIAGADGPIFSNRWHTHTFRRELLKARDARDVFHLVNRHGIEHFIAPMEASGIVIAEPALQSFLAQFTLPERLGSKYYVAKLGSATLVGDVKPLFPGQYDDSRAGISYTGSWYRDQQFASARNRTLTYSDVPGDLFRLNFTGTEITYVYTRAQNRGIAEVFIDGHSHAKLDMYSATTEWQAHASIGGLAAGKHQFEVRITPEKNPRSSGRFVDIDALIVK